MPLVDREARWNPVPDDRPAQVWLPPQRTPASAAATSEQRAAAAAATRRPRCTTPTLTPRQAVDLPRCLAHVLALQDLRPGDRVAVDLADLQSVHLTGLGLLMAVLRRCVGTDGEVLLTGGPGHARLALSGDVDLTSDLHRQAPCRS